MERRVTIIYSEPVTSRYDEVGEAEAEKSILDAVTAVRQALDACGLKVGLLPLAPPWEKAVQTLGHLDSDVVFNLFEGFPGEPETEALLPEYLEGIGLPFTGCPAKALKLCLDKARTKAILKASGISTPDYQIISPQALHSFGLGYPCIVKPPAEDASHGITETSVVNDFRSLEREVVRISAIYGRALVEKFLGGREFNVTVLDGDGGLVLPVSEIGYSLPPYLPKILTFAAKWEPESDYYGGTQVNCPAGLTSEEEKEIRALSLLVFKQLGLRGYARLDMRMDEEGHVHVLEVNPNPDISPDAGVARQVIAAGMSYNEFIKKVVRLALEEDDDG